MHIHAGKKNRCWPYIIWMQFCLLVHHNYIDRPDFDFLFNIILFVMTPSTVLVYLLLAVGSAASQETINVTVLQSDRMEISALQPINLKS